MRRILGVRRGFCKNYKYFSSSKINFSSTKENNPLEVLIQGFIQKIQKSKNENGELISALKELNTFDLSGIEKIEKIALHDNKLADHVLGLIYFTQKDYKKAAFLLERALLKGESISNIMLGDCYKLGKKFPKAFEFYEKAYNNKEEKGDYELGLCYYYGIGIKKDLEKAFDLFSNSKYGKLMQAICYLNGHGVNKDISKSIDILNEVSNYDDNAYYYLGNIYYHGLGEIKKNVKQGLDYYKQSNNPNSYLYLASAYDVGGAYEYNIEEALSYYEASALLTGNQFAQFKTGMCYMKGTGIEKNIRKGLEWLKRSGYQGNSEALFFVGMTLFYGTEEIQPDKTEGLVYLETSAEHGNNEAEYVLGNIYYRGDKGVPKSLKKSFHYFLSSSNKGNIESGYFVGLFHYNGIGCEMNKEKAIEIFQKLGELGHEESLEILKQIKV